MLITVSLTYDCKGSRESCIRSLTSAYRAYQGRVESFSSGGPDGGSGECTHDLPTLSFNTAGESND